MEKLSPLFDVTALRVQRQLSTQQSQLDQTLERLSSGLRINRAADDPAGISLARKIETRLQGAQQSFDTTQAGSLLAATAEEGVQGILNQLRQLRSLALESLDGTTTDSERLELESQLKRLVGEVDQLARGNTFNRRRLLDGSAAAQAQRRPAASRILFNRDVTDTSTGTPIQVPFLSAVVSTDALISTDSVIQFRLFQSGTDFTAGLEITSSRLGLITVTDNYLAFPNRYGIAVNGSTGPVVTVDLANLGYNQAQALSLSEYQNESLQALVADRRLQPISYGGLNLTLGGVTYNNVFNVQPNQTLEDVITGLNGLTLGTGTLSASFDLGSSRVSLSYTAERNLSRTSSASYTPAVPGVAVSGGSFASLGAPAEGPAYRDPAAFLPGAPFDASTLPPGTVFPPPPAELNGSLDFTGSDASILAALKLNNTPDSEQISAYTLGNYVAGTVAAPGQSSYVNRTVVELTSVSTTGQSDGGDTGLSAAEGDTTFQVLNTAQISAAALTAGDFSLDFGANGIFTYAGFDPDSDTLQDLVDAINTYASSTGASVSAAFDTSSNRLSIQNTPQAQVDDPGFGAGEFTLDFGDNGIFDSATALGGFDPATQSLATLVNALNSFAPGVSASFDLATDRLTLSNTTATGGNNQIVFGGANGVALASLFQVPASTPSNAVNPGDSQTLFSAADIDNSPDFAGLDLDAAAYSSTPINTLITPGSNALIFGGPNGAAVAAFFQLSDRPDTGSGTAQSSISAADLSNQAVDPSLDITPGDVATRSLNALRTPRLESLVSGALRLNGETVLTVDPATTTLNDVVSALDGFAGANGQVYSATFDTDVSRGLRIGVTDTAVLTAGGPAPAVDANGALPQISGNRLYLDSAVYVAATAPLTYNGGTPLGSGSGPAEQLSLAATPLSPQYSVNLPDPSSANISGISFSGSNLASVLFLPNVVSGAPSAVAGSERYRGSISATGANQYTLQAEAQQRFQATSTAVSSRTLGFETPVGQELGVVARLVVRAGEAPQLEDRALRLQTGPDAGDQFALGIRALSAQALRLETLSLIGVDANQTYLRGLNTLQVVDDALNTASVVLTELGSAQNSLSGRLAGLAGERENLAQQLSTAQDADLGAEIGALTRAQVNTEAAAGVLREQQSSRERVFGLLYGSLLQQQNPARQSLNLRGLD
ncbi:MAG: hypothetical protein ACO1RX_10610 [Candidatus Sericytochromatia bacterium]